ncbi:hypothetical protein LOH54_04270 [Sulfurimonas sp. HSL-3221]|uniref:hypothetical protein n=1 Tax=Sulfurimonadaceae TaxID=2771471 RepID=UPI001E4A0AE4|nr:hypothetical protein [Sulfurimonas sp. HSL-3221]UFS63349.1 hypothetical protein LOH54_04270 [Sulfurimonas sp. HSL-3221]
MKKAVSIAALLIAAIILCTWAFYKPVRIIAPQLAGVSCFGDTLCTDDASRLKDAAALYEEALRFVDTSVGEIKNAPRTVFCSSEACSESFGLGRRSAITLGTFGIIIGPMAWKRYYVRHEMIHHLQNERLGMISVLRAPKWFTEGMAYSLSKDPRPKLKDPFEHYRSQFDNWYSRVGEERLWEEAHSL